VLCAIGQPFLVNSPAKLANSWFPANERITALSIAIVAQTLGVAIGFTLPSFFITDEDNSEYFKVHIVEGLILQAGMGGVIFLIAFLGLRNKPPTPPSATADLNLEDFSRFKKSIVELMTDKNMLILMMAFGQIQGVFNTLGTILGGIASNFQYSISDGGNLGAMFIVGGIIGCIPFGIWVETKKSYKAAVIVICASACTFCLLDYFIIQ
jgi:sugar phosphate permease